jgi:DNA-binding transcriptional ArsR family regulator
VADRRPSALLEGWLGGGRAHPELLPGRVVELLRPLAFVDLMTLTGPATSMEEVREQLLAVRKAPLRRELEYLGSRFAESSTGMRTWLRQLHDGARESRDDLASLLQRYYAAAVGPFWDDMRSHMSIDRAMRGRVMAEAGVEQLLRALHHSIRWRPPVLEITRARGLAVTCAHLGGRGLVLVPSIFCTPYPMLFYSTTDDAAPPVLFYPALDDVDDAQAIWSSNGVHRCALEALLGRTRAHALELTTEPRTTTELARCLGVAASPASHHASVLRAAGLIDTRRRGGAVLHRITRRGQMLLDGMSPAVY